MSCTLMVAESVLVRAGLTLTAERSVVMAPCQPRRLAAFRSVAATVVVTLT